MNSRNRTHLTLCLASVSSSGALVDGGPSAAELAAIEAERPLIDAEVVLTDAQTRVLLEPYPSELNWRRVRRAELRVEQEARAYLARQARDGSLIGRAAS